jgi:Lon-like ATP-dependent protease
VIAISRHPVFPKFIKIIEVTDTHLMAILRRKVKLSQPYAGVFVKRDDDNTDEVVRDVDQLHPVGSFVQVMFEEKDQAI